MHTADLTAVRAFLKDGINIVINIPIIEITTNNSRRVNFLIEDLHNLTYQYIDEFFEFHGVNIVFLKLK